MKSFLRFLSLTTATQVFLLINQLVLLPLQLRIWGSDVTAHWFVITALANLASVADLGLRSAGHAQLLSSVQDGDEAARLEFRRIWALARTLVIVVTGVLLAFEVAASLRHGAAPQLWVAAVIVTLALDTLGIVRGMWLDSLGHFSTVELLFLAMVATRVLLSIVALLAFHAPPAVLAWIMLATAIGATVMQARVIRKPTSLALLAGGFSALRWRSLAVVRFVVAEPASNWMRLSLPVIVFAAISPPRFVTTYVALRAIFGLVRQVATQISRYASVSYVHRAMTNPDVADRIMSRSYLAITFVGIAMSSGVIMDHGRLLQIWLHGGDPRSESLISLSFAFGAVAYGYQVFAGVLMRSGDVVGVAKRQYVYLAASGMAAFVGYISGSGALYLALLAMQELLIAGLFAGVFTRQLRSSLAIFGVGASLIIVLWVAADWDMGGWFTALTVRQMGISLLCGAASACAGLLACLLIDHRNNRSPMAPHSREEPQPNG